MTSVATGTARSWLPAGTRPPSALSASLAAIVDAWSTRWFAARPMALSPLVPLAPPVRAGAGDFAWRALDAGMMLGTAADAAVRVGARMLDIAPDGRAAHDRALLATVAQDCLGDLCIRLAPLAQVKADASWRPCDPASGWIATIGEIGEGAPLLAIGLSDPLFALLAARALPPVDGVPLGCGTAALAASTVRMSAAVGRAAISVADLRTLEPGDVVILDRALADPVPIAIDGHALARGTARVVAAAPQPFLEIVQAARRTRGCP